MSNARRVGIGGALRTMVIMIAACGGNAGPAIHLIDAGPDAAVDAHPDAAPTGNPCNVLLQTGCAAAQKCTWIHDATAPFGHIGCEPDGYAAVGAPCTYGPPVDGLGYDNCLEGEVCVVGKCKPICDPNGGTPTCGANAACEIYAGLFEVNNMNVAGVCAAVCDPLDDNDFLNTGTKPGTVCALNEGCYGFPGTASPTRHTCAPAINPTLVHRSACTAGNGCTTSFNYAYLNGCAQGYLPLYADTTGSSQVDCIAYCKPADCWLGNCPNEQLRGVAPHDCTTASARGTFNVAVAGTNNGDQCVYSWLFEYDSMDHHIPSATSDSVGFCLDHSKYRYDSNGNNMIDPGDLSWPSCDTLPIGSGFDATFFGCVSTTTATGNGHPPLARRPLLVDVPRAPYHVLMRD